MTEVAVPAAGLVVLIGVSGSGGSAFARRHFKPAEIVSGDAFDVLHHIVGTRLRRGLLTVVDAADVRRAARAELVKLAKDHDLPADAIVFDAPEAVAIERDEGFRRVHVLHGTDAITEAEIVRERPGNDRREMHGPFDIVGDVHGCASELRTLLSRLGWELTDSTATHPEGRLAVFVGDLVDRGPDTPGVLRLVMSMVEAGSALCVSGNHEDKLVRALKGGKVKISRSRAVSLAQLGREPEAFRQKALDFMDGLVSHYVLDDGKLVVAHAGIKEAYHGRTSGRVRSFCLYGDTTGETDEHGLPVRYPWAREYRGKAMVAYGHTPVPETEWVNNTICLDTAAVFGGSLTALRYPEREIVSVPAEREWYPPTRPLWPGRL